MRRNLLIVSVLILIIVSICIQNALAFAVVDSGQYFRVPVSVFAKGDPIPTTPSPVVTATSTNRSGGSNTKQSDSSFSWLNVTIIAAVIALISATVAAIITGIFSLINTWWTHKLDGSEKRTQKEKEEIERFEKNYHDQLSSELSPIDAGSGYPALRVRTPRSQARKPMTLPPSFPQGPCDGDVWICAEQRALSRRVRGGETKELFSIIEDEKRWVVIGGVGTGKTFYLKAMAFRALRPNSNLFRDVELPIFVELEKFAEFAFLAKERFPLKQVHLLRRKRKVKNLLLFYLENILIETYGFKGKKALVYLEGKLKVGRVLLLLDGLDKVLADRSPKVARAARKRVTEVIESFPHGNSTLVVTTRERVDDPIMQSFRYLSIEKFTQEDIHKFVDKRYDAERDTASEVNALLERKVRLQAFAVTPRAISQLLNIDEYRSVPVRPIRYDQTKLYEDYSKDLFRECKTNKEELDLLERIAWHLHIKGLHSCEKKDILSIIETYIDRFQGFSKEDVFEELMLRHSLLRESAEICNQYGFPSQPLQEYFAAMHVVHHAKDIYDPPSDNPLNALKSNRHNSRWEEVISLYIQCAPEPEDDFLKELMDLGSSQSSWSLPSNPNSMNHILVGRGLMTNSNYMGPPDLRDKIKLCLYGVLLYSAPPFFIHELIASTFFEIGKKIDIEELKNLLQSSSAQNNYFPFIQELRDALKILVPGKELSPLFLCLLSKYPTMQEKLLDFVTIEENSVKACLQEPGTDDDIRRRMIATLLTRSNVACTEIFSQLLSDTSINKNVRVMMTRPLAVLAQQPLIETLFRHLDNRLLDHQVRWSLIKTLGVLGSRGIGMSDNPQNPSIAEKLLLRLTLGHGFYIDDQYLRWHIAVVLILFLGYENGDEKKKVLDKIPNDRFSEPVKSGVLALRVDRIGDAGAITTFLAAVERMFPSPPELEKCIEISEILGYLTADVDDVKTLRNIWSKIYQSSLPLDLEECMIYMEWIVGRRVASEQI